MRSVRVPWTHPETEEDLLVLCTVGPSYAGRGPTMDGPGEPAEEGEVEILEVVTDPSGVARPELLELAEAHHERIEERAREIADEMERDARDEADEREDDARREAWRE